MKLFDLHCDTATRLLNETQELYDNSLHVSLKRAEYLDSYAQVMAVWTNRRFSDAEGYKRFFEVVDNLKKEVDKNTTQALLVNNSNELLSCLNDNKIPLILAVEDARILENDLKRLQVLHSYGVRILTLNWYGETCIGGGHNTNVGLTDFGISVVKNCFEFGIIPDISHCSFEGAKMTLDLAKEYKKPIIASHSDSYSVNPHTRNLQDEDFKRINEIHGLVGINLCPEHLSSKSSANIFDILNHIEHYLSLGGENTIAMGGDLDGTNLPDGFSGVEDIYKIADEMQKLNYSEELINKIMYKNAFDFFKSNF
ncbi:MAG: membrane dipeptidase [Clostridia bacterium]|nr:membrane dipeptidase [Clostridia bacterium]